MKKQEKAVVLALLLGLTIVSIIGFYFVGEIKFNYSTFYVVQSANFEGHNFNVFKLVNKLLLNGFNVYLVTETREDTDISLRLGDFLVPTLCDGNHPFATNVLDAYMGYLCKQLNVSVKRIELNFGLKVLQLNKPKVAVYYGEGTTGNAIEEIRVLEEAEFELRLLNLSEIKNLETLDANVIIFPGGGPYRSYLNEGEISNIKRFISNGGGYVGICGGATFGAEIGLLNVKLMRGELYPQFPEYADFYGPVNLRISPNNALTLGYGDFLECMYFRGPFFGYVSADVEVAAFFDAPTDKTERYFPEIAKIYGFNPNTASINKCLNTPAVVFGNYGNGRVVLSSVHPEILKESRRFFINMIFFALSRDATVSYFQPLSNKRTFQSKTYPSRNGFYLNLTSTFQETKDALRTLQSLAEEISESLQVLTNINQKLIGITADYLNLFVNDISLRCNSVLIELEKLATRYTILENIKESLCKRAFTPILEKKLLLEVIEITYQIEDIFISSAKSGALNAVLMEKTRREVFDIIEMLNNFSLTFKMGEAPESERVVELYLKETTVTNGIKRSIECSLLNISFKIKSVNTKLEFLREVLRVNSCLS